MNIKETLHRLQRIKEDTNSVKAEIREIVESNALTRIITQQTAAADAYLTIAIRALIYATEELAK